MKTETPSNLEMSSRQGLLTDFARSPLSDRRHVSGLSLMRTSSATKRAPITDEENDSLNENLHRLGRIKVVDHTLK